MTMQEFARREEPLREKLFRTALAILGSPSAAEEALDETVFRGLQACGRLRETEYFTTWLTRILLNACTDELRRRKRETVLDALPETGAEAYDGMPIREALARIPRELRDVAVLRYVSGYTLAETAEILDIPPSTVSYRQQRALDLLRLELEGEDENESQ